MLTIFEGDRSNEVDHTHNRNLTNIIFLIPAELHLKHRNSYIFYLLRNCGVISTLDIDSILFVVSITAFSDYISIKSRRLKVGKPISNHHTFGSICKWTVTANVLKLLLSFRFELSITDKRIVVDTIPNWPRFDLKRGGFVEGDLLIIDSDILLNTLVSQWHTFLGINDLKKWHPVELRKLRITFVDRIVDIISYSTTMSEQLIKKHNSVHQHQDSGNNRAAAT
jgi:hypothetical protein